MTRLLLFYLLFICALSTKAQDYISSVTHYHLEDGLSHNQVKWIHKDRSGIIWVGAINGINRFDGREFKLLAEVDLFEARYSKIFEDWEGDLWLKQKKIEDELIFFNVKTGRLKTFTEKFGNEAPFSPFHYGQGLVLSDNKVVVGTTDGRLLFFDANRKIKTIKIADQGIVQPLEILDDGRFWVMVRPDENSNIETDEVVVILFNGEGQEESIRQKGITGYAGKGREDQLFLHTENDLFELFPSGKLVKHHTSQLGDFLSGDILLSVGRCIYDPKYDHFWICQNKRVLIFNLNNGQVKDLSNEYNDLAVVGYYWTKLDNDQTFWLGTISGLFKIQYKRNLFQQYLYKKGGAVIKEDHIGVRGIATDDHGNIFANTEGKTIQIAKDKKRIELSSNNPKLALTYDKEMEELWTVSDFNLVKINRGQQTKVIDEGELSRSSYYVWSMHIDQNKRLWLGTEAGLTFKDHDTEELKTFQKYNEFGEVATAFKYCFYPEGKDHLWMCTSNGLFLLNAEKGITERYWPEGEKDFYLPSMDLRHMHRDADGVYWIASREGLIRWDKAKKESRLFTTKDGFSHNHICAIYEDEFGYLWMSSDNGIMQFEKTTFKVRTFLPSDGITHREFNRISHHQAADGTLYFGGLNGITSFHPKDFQANFNKQPDIPLVLLDCDLYSAKRNSHEEKITEFQTTGRITMAPDDRYLSLQFALLDYWNSPAIKYAYTMDTDTLGSLQDWNIGKEGALRIGALDYGDHLLTIKGKTANGLFSKQELVIPIRVLTPFYLQYWFLAFGTMAFLCALFFIQKVRTKVLLKRQFELEETVAQRTKTIRTQTEELKALDKAKSKFLANISHELRTPLTLILNTIRKEDVFRIIDKEEKMVFSKKEMHIMDRNTNRLKQLIEQLLDLSKLESGNMLLRNTPGNFKLYLKGLSDSFKSLSEKQKVNINFTSDDADYNLLFDKDKTDKIFYNLISNALKFTPKGGTISLALHKEVQNIRVEITDTGIGISEKEIGRIFDRFYQVKQQDEYAYNGTGIGLSLVKELVEVYGGTINVRSQLNRGTSFLVELPLEPYVENELLESNGDDNKPNLLKSDVEKTIKKQPILLVVEDNEDLRYQQEKAFEKNYEVRLAKDGNEGLAVALAEIPDVIICDVMMPGKNGYDLCRQLKMDERTNHIPIVLLTAKTAQAEKIEGLMVGADAYISKPYDPQELRLTVHNLLERNQNMQKQLAIPNNTAPKELLQSPQHKFMLKINDTIEEHLSDGLFGVEQLGELLGLSRSQLFRKLKAISGQTPIGLIRTHRLQKAKVLLQQGSGSATEVAYLVGFNDPNYFFKCFKKEFGMTAGEWVAQHTVKK